MRQNGWVPGRIVVGIDGTEHAAAALCWAAEEASLRGATLVAVHARSFVPLTTPADSGLVPMAWTESIEGLDASRTAAEMTAVDVVRQVLGEENDAVVKVGEGGATSVLLEAAQDADLLVVGNQGRGNIASALLGSTSAEVADAAPCPVVIVRAPGD
jgi:nucleotide-binding universal stress UspA family protein